jgi:hypothetical protein
MIVLPSLFGSAKPNDYLDELTPAHLRPVALLGQNVAISGLKDTRRNASKLSHDPSLLVLKLSRGLVLTSW